MTSLFDHGAYPPCPRPFNLAAHVLARGAATPDKVALAILGPARAERWSYARLISAVRGTATGLLELGLRPGDRLLMRLDNDVEFPIAYLGAIAVGLVPVPTSPQLTAPETEAMLALIWPAAILRAPGIACAETDLPVIGPETLAAMRALPPADWHMGDPDRLAYIIFTSGTSGVPRAVCHAHRAIWARGMMQAGWEGLTPDDRLCHAGAFNWTYTLGTGLMDPWTQGATALIPAPGTDLGQLPLLLARHDATIFAAAPGVYRKILNQNDRLALPRLRHGLSAGEKLSESLRDRWEKATGTPVFEAFGMSECSTFISSCPGRPADPATLGRPQPGRRVAILEDGAPVPRGAPGTIAVHRGDPGLMLGYLDAPEATAARMSGDWFLTGDLGAMDADDQVTYLGRADDMMNAGGYRVSPIEVEAALAACPGIAQCAVTEIEVRADARVIAAFYTGPETLPEDTLDRHMRARLAGYKCPRLYTRVPALPTGPNGKVQRRALGQMKDIQHDPA